MTRASFLKRSLIHGLTCATLLSFAASHASASIAVEWGGNYSEEPQALGNTTAEDFITTYGTGVYASLSILGDGPRNLTPTSGYHAPEGKSSTFWGGWMASTPDSESTATIPGNLYPNTDSPLAGSLNSRAIWANRINIAVSRYQTRLRGMVYFVKSDFLNDLNNSQVGFDTGSALSFTGISDGNFGPNLRWIVQDGSTWYISEAQGIGTYNTSFTMTMDDPNSALWAAFEPYSAGTYNAAPDTGYGTHTFSDIQAVGIYFDSYGLESRAYDGDSWTRFSMESFSMEASAIPEPSVTAFAGITLLSLGGVKLGRKIAAGKRKHRK